jgi:hypothetical protein
MTARLPVPARAAGGRDVLRSLLQLYGRYAALIAEQLDALDRRDYPRLQQLALDRERVQRDIEARARDAGDDYVEGLRGGAADVDHVLSSALEQVQQQAEDDAALRDRLERLRGSALSAAKGLALRRAERRAAGKGGGVGNGSGAYVQEQDPEPAEHRLDVRF